VRSKPLDPRAPIHATHTIDHSRMYYDAPGDGSLWARGAHYKASFDASGATYFPLFSPCQPQHYPHALSPDAVTIGGVELAFDRAAAAARDVDRIDVDRGAFIESYAFEPERVEQTFTFASLPNAGDLELHIPVASSLEARSTADALEFRSEYGRMTYARAVAIDASGRRAAAATELRDGAITIRVDAEFLASAALPLVIDPVVSIFDIDATSYDDYRPDVAYDANTQRWLAVYEEVATAGDGDVYYQVMNAAGSGMWGGYVNVNNASWTDVHCANLASATQFLAVAHVWGSGTDTIRGRTIEADIFSISGEFTISGGESGAKINPSVGGDPYPFAPAFYCVAYERIYDTFHDDDILVRLVGPDGSLSAVNYLSNSGNTLDDLPAVSRSNGGSTWTVSWERHDLDANTSDIWAGRILFDGTTVNGPFQITAGSDDTYSCASSPLVGTQRTMIVFQRNYGTDYDIHAVVLDGASVVTNTDISTLESTWFLQDQREASVDSDGQHFLVAYSEQFLQSTTDYDVYVSDLYLDGSTLGLAQTHMNLAFTAQREGVTRIASTHSAGGPNKRYLVAWQREASATNFNVEGALVDGLEGGAVTPFCAGDGSAGACPCNNNGITGNGCGNSAHAAGSLLTATGNASTVDDTLVLHVSGTPNTATCTFLQGTPLGGTIPFGDGLRCIGGTLLRLGSKVASGGNAAYPGAGDTSISLKGGVPWIGATRAYQVQYRDNSATFCTSATFNISSGVTVQWAP
jgi:hypothetical protein